MPKRRNWLYMVMACLALALAALSGACGGGDDDDNGGDVATATPTQGGATPTGDSGNGGGDGDALDGTTFEINETFWHSGFEVELGQGEIIATKDVFDRIDGYVLSIEAGFTNNGDSSSFFDPDVTVVQGTKNYSSSFQSDTPQVGSGLTAEGTLIFVIDEEFDYTKAKLVAGAGSETQAVIPFAPGAGEKVALEPQEVALTGSASLALIDLNFTGGELRYDVPLTYEQVDDGDIALTLNFTAVSRKSGNWSIFAQDLALTKPNGNTIGADGANLTSLPGNDAGTATEDLYVRFIIDAEPAGEYSLRFKPGDYWIESGPAEATFDFTLQ